MNHHPHSYPQFSNGPNLTLKKVIGLTEAHQDKFWTKLLPFLNQLQVGLEILDNLASTYQQGQNIISVWTQKRFKKKDRTHQKKRKKKKREMELKNYSSQECMWVWHGSVSVLRSTRFSLIMASWGTMLVFYASLYPLLRVLLSSKHSKSMVFVFYSTWIVQSHPLSQIVLVLLCSHKDTISIHSILSNSRNGGRSSVRRC